MILHLLKGFSTAFSLTLMLLAIVYTEQTRTTREAAPTRIGETRVQDDFLVEYAEMRQELLMGFLREKFPSLDLPEPEAAPVNSLSLEALHQRQVSN
jgi:hypothetical protein